MDPWVNISHDEFVIIEDYLERNCNVKYLNYDMDYYRSTDRFMNYFFDSNHPDCYQREGYIRVILDLEKKHLYPIYYWSKINGRYMAPNIGILLADESLPGVVKKFILFNINLFQG